MTTTDEMKVFRFGGRVFGAETVDNRRIPNGRKTKLCLFVQYTRLAEAKASTGNRGRR